jgi:hypothetical protein
MIGRNIYGGVAALAPGITGSGGLFGGATGSASTSQDSFQTEPGFQINAGGQRQETNEYQIDGASVNGNSRDGSHLEQSRCFRASAGALSCLTCHAPHEPLRRNDFQFYSAKCAACHAPGRRLPPAPACQAGSAPDCTACHMPAVAADPHLKFRNHWIGVYGGGNLMPLR